MTGDELRARVRDARSQRAVGMTYCELVWAIEDALTEFATVEHPPGSQDPSKTVLVPNPDPVRATSTVVKK